MPEDVSVKQGIAAGTSMAAAIVMVTVGIIQLFQGIAAVAENEMFVVGVQYVYKFDLSVGGWIHIGLGVLVIVVGLALFTGTGWARVSAIVVAALSILANFLWLPPLPLVVDTDHRPRRRGDLGRLDLESDPDGIAYSCTVITAR